MFGSNVVWIALLENLRHFESNRVLFCELVLIPRIVVLSLLSWISNIIKLLLSGEFQRQALIWFLQIWESNKVRGLAFFLYIHTYIYILLFLV